MAVGFIICDNCKNCRIIDGWNMACDAYPEGLPRDISEINPYNCGNSVHYEPEDSPLRQMFAQFES